MLKRTLAALLVLLVSSAAYAQGSTSSTSAAGTPSAPEQTPAAPSTPPSAASPTTPPPAPKPTATPFTFALKGFVSMSAYWQDGVTALSEGQQALFAASDSGDDTGVLGFDLRHSRFNFSVKGPKVLNGATPQAVLEIDFFQGFGGGAFGNVSLLNRMRLAYSELAWKNHRLAVGQLNDLTFAMAPNSLAHIGFPLGYGTGNIGWRRPGFWGFHNFGAPDMKVEFAWEVGRSQWNDAAAGGVGNNTVNTPGGMSLGEASGLPALQGRLTLTMGPTFSAFVAGHWSRVDGNGFGVDGGEDLDIMAVNAGAKLVVGPLTVAATGFTGNNTGPLLGNIVQLQTGGASGAGTGTGAFNAALFEDVAAWGAWGQVGFNLTKELSAWAFYGLQEVDEDDAKQAQFTRFGNQTTDLMVQYRSGGYAVGLEWIRFITDTGTYAGTPPAFTSSNDIAVNQTMLSANYFF